MESEVISSTSETVQDTAVDRAFEEDEMVYSSQQLFYVHRKTNICK